jgi:hypothetical protein
MPCSSDESQIHCSCTYTSCDKHGHCCKCVTYHKDRGEIPGCLFSTEAERGYDRSLSRLVIDRGMF